MRRGIKPNEGTRIPTSLVLAAVQTHTVTNSQSLAQIHYFDWLCASHCRWNGARYEQRATHDTRRYDTFWKWILGRCCPSRTVFVICNDAGQLLTLTGFWELIDECEWNQRWCRVCGNAAFSDICCGKKVWRGTHVTSDPPVIITVRNSLGILKIVSASNYFNRARDLSGNALAQLHELQDEFLPVMQQWHKQNNGCWQTTAAGLAWTSWRHTLTRNQVIRDDSPEQTAIARAAYHAGQCEAYYIGEVREKVYKVDGRAFYPNIMRQGNYPISFSHCNNGISIDRLIKQNSVLLPIATVTIKSDTETYPVKFGGRLLFATGEYVTTLAAPELIPAIKRGHVHSVHSVAWYHAGNPFTAWVDKWLRYRMQAEKDDNMVLAAFHKLILNSLSGKFGAWSVRWRDVEYPNPPARWCEWNEVKVKRIEDGKPCILEATRMRARAGWVQELLDPAEGRESIPSIAAFITSYGRERMRELKSLCPDKSVLYQDTDAVIVTQRGLDALRLDKRIFDCKQWGFRVEETAERCYLHTQKDYEMNDKVTAAGVKSEHRRVQLRAFEQYNMQRLNGILSSTPKEYTHSQLVTVMLNGNVSHRLLLDDCWTKPHHIVDSK